MKKIIAFAFLLALLLNLAAVDAGVRSFRTPDGMAVLLESLQEFPYLNFTLLVRNAGTISCEREGLPLLTARLLLKGSAKTGAAELQDRLDMLGATIQVGVEEDFTVLSGGVLSKNSTAFFELLGEILARPAFLQKEFDLELDKLRQSLKAVLDSPQSLVFNYFRHLYFQGQPFGRLSSGTEKSLNEVSLQEVRTFYRERYLPSAMIISVAGDLSEKELSRLVAAKLKLSPGNPPAGAVGKKPQHPSGKRLFLIDKPDSVQSYFVLAFPGHGFGFEKSGELELFNTIFGGRFTSWLNSELRIKRGLTYGARSGMESFQDGGVYYLSSYTKNEQLQTMLDVVWELVGKASKEGISSAELQSGRNYIRGQQPRRTERWQSRASNNAMLFAYGLPFDYYSRLLDKLGGISLADVNGFARGLLSGEDYLLVVVGKGETIRPLLAKYGRFEELRADLNF